MKIRKKKKGLGPEESSRSPTKTFRGSSEGASDAKVGKGKKSKSPNG